MRFSIITCTFNSERFLEECLKSVAIQTFKDYEVIVVDGKSTDATNDIVIKYSKKLPLKVYKQTPHGISIAMNEGLKRSRGEYIFYLHSDDNFFDKNVLNDTDKFLTSFDNPSWIYGKIRVIEENGQKVGVFPNKKVFQIANPVLLKYFNYIPHQSVFIKKNTLEEQNGFDKNLSSGMDYDLWLKLISKTKCCFFDRIIANFRIHKHATSSSLSKKKINQENTKMVRQKHLTMIELLLTKSIEIIVNTFSKTYR